MSVATKNLGSYVTEERSVSGFNSIHLRGCGLVRLQQTGAESLEVRAPKRWMDRIETKVKNGALILGFKKRVFPFFFLPMRNRGDIEFLITADVIEQLGISGLGSFEIDELRTEDLRLGISGSGRIVSRSIDAKDVRVNISGSGKVEADRLHADAIEIKSSGVAKVRSR
jgi:Putative auto-transporter adhesin, head GIN domain